MNSPISARFQPALLRLLHVRSNFIPVALTIVILLVFLAAGVNLIKTLNMQYETGQEALNSQLVEQGQSFTQLQREALRLLTYVNMPLDRLDYEAAQLQIDLLASRFFQLRAVADQASTRPEQAEVALRYVSRQGTIVGTAGQWMASPGNAALRVTVINQLTELEKDVNLDVINFGRTRVQSVISFRDATNHVQTAFVLSSLSFVALMLALLYNLYRFLRQAQMTEAALQTVRFKDQFLAVMSHELRTPLNAIIGFLGIMKMQGASSTKLPHMIERSRANAERLLNLIDDILDMSKIEAGKFEINPEAVAIREVVKRWKSQTEILAQQKGLEFSYQIDSALPQYIEIDVDAVSKIAINLLSNALKFTEKGSVRLEVQALRNQWCIRVTDTGIGIPQDKLGIIFESFRQVDGSIRRNFGGSGLGLSIVKQLSELMGGQVTVESQAGQGSTFTITLPLVAATMTTPQPELVEI